MSSGLRCEPKWDWHFIPQQAGADNAALPFSTTLNFWRRRKLLQWISWSHLKGPGPITWVVWWIESKIDRSDDVTLNERPIALSVIIHYTVKFQFLPNQCNYWPSAGALTVCWSFSSPKWERQAVVLIQSNDFTRVVFVLKWHSWHTDRCVPPQGLRVKAWVSFSPWLLLFMNTIMAPLVFKALSQTLISHAAILIFFIKH